MRNTLGYKGIIISDDLCMGGARASADAGEAALASINAGHNLLIISRDLKFQRTVAVALKKRFDENAEFAKMCAENGKKLRALQNAD